MLTIILKHGRLRCHYKHYITNSYFIIFLLLLDNEDSVKNSYLIFSWLQAFGSDFGDNEGKEAVSNLLEEMVKIVAPDKKIRIFATGAATQHPSVYSSRIRVKRTVLCSSVESSPKSDDDDGSSQGQPQWSLHVFDTGVIYPPKATRQISDKLYKSPGRDSVTTTSSDASFNKVWRLSDVFMYIRNSPADPPISLLEVEVKKGEQDTPAVLLENMLGRLPYQQENYGLYINAKKASVWRVSRRENNQDVNIERLGEYEYTDIQGKYEVISPTKMCKLIDKIAEIIKVQEYMYM